MRLGELGGSSDGRAALLAAAGRLLAKATFTDAVAFLTAQRVADEAGSSKGNFSHHFRGTGRDRPKVVFSRSLAQSLLRPRGSETVDGTLRAMSDRARLVREPDPGEARQIVAAAVDTLLAYTDQPAAPEADVAWYLAVGVAPNDADMAATLRALLADITARYETVLDDLLRATGRRIAGDRTRADVVNALIAVGNGFVLRRRFEPDAASPALLADATVGVFLTFTVEVAGAGADPFESLEPPSGRRHLAADHATRVALVATAGEVYRTGGWPALTVPTVAVAAGVSRDDVLVAIGGRPELAAVVLAEFVPALCRALGRDAHLPLIEQVRRHLQRVAELAHSHVEVASAVLAGPELLGSGRPVEVSGIIGPLEELLGHRRASLRPELDDDGALASLAALITVSVMHAAIAARPRLPSVVADFVADAYLVGAVRQRPRRPHR